MNRKKKRLSYKFTRRTAFLLVLVFVLSLAGCGKKQEPTGQKAGSVFDLFAEGEDPFDEAITATEKHTGDYEVDPPDMGTTSGSSEDTTEPATEPATDEPVYADVESQEFNDLLMDIFRETITSSKFYYTNYVKDPNDYGIEKPQDITYAVTTITPDTYEEAKKELEEEIKRFEAIDVNTLTEKQRFDYDYMMDKLVSSRVEIDSYMLTGDFDIGNGIQGNMTPYFATYDFDSKDDVEDYLSLIKDLPEYVQACLDAQTQKVEAGYGSCDLVLDYMIQQCDDCLGEDIDESTLVVCFNEKLEDMDFLTAQEKEEYSKKVRDSIEQYYYPAFENMKSTFQSWKGKGKANGGLCNYGEEGKTYYKYLIRYYTGSDMSPEEMINYLDEKYNEFYSRFYAMCISNPDAYEYYINNHETLYDYLKEQDAAGVIQHMIDDCMPDFPKIQDLDFQVDKMSQAMSRVMLSATAFYSIPCVNDYESNVINISSTNENEYWGTLAHEGCPGHMYQVNYYRSTNPQPLRYIQMASDLGYMEGWAEYASEQSYKYCDYDNNQYASWIAEAETIQSILSLIWHARIDLGINYLGWSRDELYQYMVDNNLASDKADKIYAVQSSTPAAYLSYSIGLFEMKDLRSYAEQELGDKFDAVEYHKAILEHGPCKFAQLRKCVDKYIAEHK